MKRPNLNPYCSVAVIRSWLKLEDPSNRQAKTVSRDTALQSKELYVVKQSGFSTSTRLEVDHHYVVFHVKQPV